ncbi:MAG: DcrB-related protein [Firmicutes bacterium]|nr:DcrB-related protein [Bacillota bacterium]
MKKRHLAIITLVALFVVGIMASQAFADTMKTYTNKAKGFSIDFPSKWEVKEKVSDVDVIALSPVEGKSDKFRENVNVIALTVPTSVTLKVFYDENVKDMKKKLKKFTVVSESNTKINGQDARKLVYTHNMYNHTMKAAAYVMLKGGKACFITCTAAPETYSKWEAEFDKIAKTTKF